MGQEDKYSKAENDRRAYVDAILNSDAAGKIIVAGPGTGKTFLFKELLLKGEKKSALTLTFVNSLVEDLSLELRGLSEVRTLHGFARGVLSRATGSVRVFPLLSRIIKDEYKIHSGLDVDFDRIFNERDDQSDHIPFYKARKDFYRHNGHTDLIYAAALYLEKNPNKIPVFDLVLVDEYQDFNELEVSLITLLASKNSIVIAGDDDQALYFFKGASPSHIRDRYSGKTGKYVPFTLVHCSRCPRVVVDAFNDVVKSALTEKYLQARLDKQFLYFEDPRRSNDSSKIVHILSHSSQIPYAIEQQLDSVASDRREPFSTLVIAPTKNQCRALLKGLRRKGFRRASFVDRDESPEPGLLDGVMLLLEDKESNLGWRIIAKAQLSEVEFEGIVKRSLKNPTVRFQELVDPVWKKRVKKVISRARKITKGRAITEEECSELFSELGVDSVDISKIWLREKLEQSPAAPGLAGLRDLPIKITTIPGAKGLSEDYVFIAHFDDRFFLDKNGQATDQNICNLLVALTRARKCLYLISCTQQEPKFLTWISKDRIESIDVRSS